MRVDDGEVGLFEAEAGWLEIEAAVQNQLALALGHGAQLRTAKLLGWHAGDGGITVTTSEGVARARALVLALGAWAGPLLADLGVELTVHRNLMFWLPADARWEGAPCFGVDSDRGFFYGFPRSGGTIKIAHHAPGARLADPDVVDRSMRAADFAPIAAFAADRLSGVTPTALRHAVCLYEMSPDGHFIIDAVPGVRGVAFAAGLSGHGFKFTPVLGEALADLALDGATALPIGFLRASRFDAGRTPMPAMPVTDVDTL